MTDSVDADKQIPARPSKIRQVPFDTRCAALVAEVLGAEWAVAPFRLPSGAVFQITVPGASGRPSVLLTLWPSIRRVDAIGPALAVVFTDIAALDLVGDIEVQFRRANREYLIVARGGKVIVRA